MASEKRIGLSKMNCLSFRQKILDKPVILTGWMWKMGSSPYNSLQGIKKGRTLKSLSTLIAIVSLLSLLACSRSREPKAELAEVVQVSQEFSAKEQALPSHKTKFMSWRDGLRRPVHSYDNECKDCPASVAQILIKGSSRCFGGLVAEDLVMTSRHCIPERLLRKGASCKNSIRFLFSGNQDFNARSMGCDEVVDFIPEPKWAKRQRLKSDKKEIIPHPDWVLLRTRKKMPSRMAEVQESGIADAKKLFIYFPQFNNNEETVTVNKIQCEAVQKSPFFPFYINDKSPMVSIRCDQQLTNGSSGSNLYNKDGQIVGTLSHGLAYIKKGKKLRFKIIKGKKFTPWLAINNTSCILNIKDEDKAGCVFDHTKKKALRKQILLSHIKAAEEKAENEFIAWQESVNLPIRWERVDTNDLESLPNSYKKIFEKRKNRRKNWLNPTGNVALTKLFVPSYPKCLEKAMDNANVPHPYAKVRIHRSPLRRVLVNIKFASTKGAIVRKGEQKWGFHFLNSHNRPRIRRSENDFFHAGAPPLHHGELSLCE